MKRAQVWSIDVMLAVVIFLSIMIVFYTTLFMNDDPKLNDLQTEATIVRNALSSDSDISFIQNSQIDSTKFNQFIADVNDNYVGVKQEFGINSDFCIYFEDEQGNLILLNNTYTGIGSSDIAVGGTPCSVAVS